MPLRLIQVSLPFGSLTRCGHWHVPSLHVAENTTSPHHLIKHQCSFSPMPETIIRRTPVSPIRSTACGPLLLHPTQPSQISLAQLFLPSLLEFYSTHIDAYSQAIGSFFSYPRHLQSLLSANSKLPASLIPLQQGWSGSLPSPLFIFKAQPNLVLSKRSLSWGFSNPDCDIGSLAPHSVTSSQPRAEKPISASFFRFLPNANRN